jgi:hypothetical protein
MLPAGLLVAQVYRESQFHSSQAAFRSNVPALSEAYRTPLFDLLQRAFYTLVVNTFRAHPARYQIPWLSTDGIFEVAFPRA